MNRAFGYLCLMLSGWHARAALTYDDLSKAAPSLVGLVLSLACAWVYITIANRERLAALRADAARPPKHRHEWTYTGPTGTGWLIARCDCGEWDIAS